MTFSSIYWLVGLSASARPCSSPYVKGVQQQQQQQQRRHINTGKMRRQTRAAEPSVLRTISQMYVRPVRSTALRATGSVNRPRLCRVYHVSVQLVDGALALSRTAFGPTWVSSVVTCRLSLIRCTVLPPLPDVTTSW